MTEQYYQKKIIKWIEALGGVAINGTFSKSGEADLQCGIPIGDKLMHLAIEVKTEENYNRIMKHVSEFNGLYVASNDKLLKPHEKLQMVKLNRNRKLGGLALLAFSTEQIKAYIEGISNATPTLPTL
jgi:hypothetical protein